MSIHYPSSILSSLFDSTAFTNVGTRFRHGADLAEHALSTVDIRSRATTGIAILTAEGDKVTLSTNTTVSAQGTMYNARGVVDGQAVRLQGHAVEARSTRRQILTVEGDLNEREIRAIQQVVEQVNRISRQAASGHRPAALDAGQGIRASGPLAAVGVQIQVVETATATTIGQIRAQEPRDVSPADSRAPSSRQSASDRPADPVSEHPARGDSPFFDQIGDRLVKKSAGAIRELLEKFGAKVEGQADELAKTLRRTDREDSRERGERHGTIEKRRHSVADRVATLEKIVQTFASRLRESLEQLGKLFDGRRTALGPHVPPEGSPDPEPTAGPTEASPRNPEREPRPFADLRV